MIAYICVFASLGKADDVTGTIISCSYGYYLIDVKRSLHLRSSVRNLYIYIYIYAYMLLMGYQRLKKDQQAVCVLKIASDSVVEMRHQNAGSMLFKITIATA